MASEKGSWFGMFAAKQMLRQALGDLGGASPVMRRRLLNRLVSRSRDMTRKNITSQGKGSWRPLSKWTMAQTGRRKALITLRKFIGVKKASPRALRAAVVFRSPGNFTLTQHHFGFKDKATGGIVRLELKRPGALGLPSKVKSKTFVDKHSRDVPARPVWPSLSATLRMVRSEARKWRREVDRRLSRR